MPYGTQIGRKFHTNGTAAAYPGNTVIADALPGTLAYEVMVQCLAMLREAGLQELFIPLPEDSYHMTVIRGVNDLVREPAFWPDRLPLDAPLEQADAYMSRAIASVPDPGPMRMRFGEARITEEDFRIGMLPADEEQAEVLRRYRDQVADAVGLRLPGHDTYTYHITLAYTWRLPDEGQKETIACLKKRMDALLSAQGQVELQAPYTAYYQDMLSFAAQRLPK